MKTSKNDSKTPWYLVPPTAGVTQLKHQDIWHTWCTDCTSPSWRCHTLGDEHKKFVDHHKCKKATILTATLATMESNTAATLTATHDEMTPAITPSKATTISWAGL
eukprot:453891-Ditylum_brightwellii.AAC.1